MKLDSKDILERLATIVSCNMAHEENIVPSARELAAG
jgi:hypothetical protein